MYDIKRTLIARKKVIITLSGTSGTATIAGLGAGKTITFLTSLTATASAFAVANLSYYDSLGVIISANYETLVFTEKVEGTGFTDPTITNVTTDLTGSVYSTLYPEPITLGEMKEFVLNRADADVQQDALLTELITTSRELAEQFCNRSFIPQTIELTELIKEQTTQEFILPYPNHIEIIEVKVNDEVTTDYDTIGINRLIIQMTGRFWTSTVDGNKYYLKYKAGDCPTLAKSAIMQICKDMYENRGKDPMTSNGFLMLNPLKVYS